MEVENVRVVVRVKPMSQEEIMDGVESAVSFDGQVITLKPPAEVSEEVEEFIVDNIPLTPKSNKTGPPRTPKTPKVKSLNLTKTKKFAFDKIYDPSTPQTSVFADIDSFVESAINGYNSTIFAYGQTGSGKTHTMMGPSADPGIIPRAIKRMFELIENKPNTMFVVQCTYVELYLDKFVDLLDPNNAPAKRRNRLPIDKPPKIEIHEDTRNKNIFLTGSDTLRTTVTSSKQALDLIKRGTSLRTVASTNMNEASSRSHSILTFHIESRDNTVTSLNCAVPPVHIGKLNLVDLAGSERISKSGVEGINQKEAQNINSSLTALGDVLAALSSKNYNGPIPYRNSKLTRLLQDSLGGNSKTFFIVNVDPATHNYQETMMSLTYGQRAKKVRNLTCLNRDMTGDSDLEKLNLEVQELRKRLLERTKEYERIREQGASTVEENKQLKVKLELLSRINQLEIADLEEQMADVIHSQKTEIVEMRYVYTSLQSKLDTHLSQIHELKLELAQKEDEKDVLSEKLVSLSQEKTQLEHKVKELAEKEKELRKSLESAQTEEISTSKSVAQLEKIKAKLEAKEAEIEELKSQREKLERKHAKLEAENEKLKSQLDESKERISQLEKAAEEAKKSGEKESKKRKSKKKTEETVEEEEQQQEEPVKKRKKSTKKEKEEPVVVSETEEEVVPMKKKKSKIIEEEKEEVKEPEVPKEKPRKTKAVDGEEKKKRKSKIALPDVSPIPKSSPLQEISNMKSKMTDVSLATQKRKLFSTNTSIMTDAPLDASVASVMNTTKQSIAKQQLKSVLKPEYFKIPKLKLGITTLKKPTLNKENEVPVL